MRFLLGTLLAARLAAANSWYVLLGGDGAHYHSVVCRMKGLLVSAGVSEDHIMTIGYANAHKAPFPDATVKDCEFDHTNGEDDFTVNSDNIDAVLDGTYTTWATTKTSKAVACNSSVFPGLSGNCNMMLYVAADTGYDLIRLSEGKGDSSQMYHGNELFDKLTSLSTFDAIRVYVDGSDHGWSVMKTSMTGYSAKKLKVTASSTSGGASPTVCYCPNQNEICMSTRFGLTFLETGGLRFSDHLTTLTSALTTAQVPTTLTSGTWTDASATTPAYNAVLTDGGADFPYLPWWNQALAASGTDFANNCVEPVTDAKLRNHFYKWTNDWKEQDALASVFGDRKSADDQFTHVVSTYGQAACGTCDSLTVSLTTAAQKRCYKNLVASFQKYVGWDSYSLKAHSHKLANICASTAADTAAEANDLAVGMNSYFCGQIADSPCVYQGIEPIEHHFEATQAFAYAGFAVGVAVFLFFTFCDEGTLFMRREDPVMDVKKGPMEKTDLIVSTMEAPVGGVKQRTGPTSGAPGQFLEK